MNNNDIVYVTGHQHPDTDSVASAIAYAFFKKTQGVRAVPCRLGKLNSETKYLLKRFGFEEPMLLEDARKTLAEIEIDPPLAVKHDATIQEAIDLLIKNKRRLLAVLDDDNRLCGVVTKSDLASVGFGDTAQGIASLKETPISYISKTISGTTVYDDPQTHINGKVSIIAHSESGLEKYDVKDRIVIVGNDPAAQIQLIEKEAGALIVVWAENVQEEVVDKARQYHCPIIISGHGTMNTSRYIYFAPPVHLVMTKRSTTFFDHELVEDASKKMARTRFSSFPVINDNNELVGYVGRYHVMNYENKKIILVDHNEFAQSVRAVEKAKVLEVLDHHRINDFSSDQPVQFRNEIIGSTATIITKIFRENQLPIQANLAGLLLGAVLSDTLMFESPTCTQVDIDQANYLAAMANLDIEEFGRQMFTESSNIEEKSISELMNQDIKYYEIGAFRTMISQITAPSLESFYGRDMEIQHDLDVLTKKKGLDLCVLAISGIMDRGSIFFASGDKSKWVMEAFPNKEGEMHSLQEGVLSRKKQIVPMVTEAISRYA